SLAAEPPSRTSILNVLPAVVREIDAVDDAQVNVVVTIGHSEHGPKLLARISKRAQDTLGLAPGQAVFAQVKAVSLIAGSGHPIGAPETGRPAAAEGS